MTASEEGTPSRVRVRPARPDELAAVGDLTADAYVADGHLEPDNGYVETLRAADRRAEAGDVLVAVEESGRLLGAVALFTFAAGPDWAEQCEPGDAIIRMLAASPRARGLGVGAALTTACVERARELGCRRVRLSTQPSMKAAHRIYERLGFRRAPENDWEPAPGVQLLGYQLELSEPAFCEYCGRPAGEGAHTSCQLGLEPPRFCRDCRRRMVVQVTPAGWTARCVEHGVRTG